MAVNENKSYLDTLDDEIGRAVRAIDWSVGQKQHKINKQAITNALEKVPHEKIGFRKERMNLNRVNESVLIKIGPKKRGHLAAYCGSWVRLVWLYTYGGYTMVCAVQKLEISKEVEETLLPCGPYTKNNFTKEIQVRHPYGHAMVDGDPMIRISDGRWIKSTPTDAALENKEKDDIPDGNNAWKNTGGYATYQKQNGRWVRTSLTRCEFEDGACLELPIGSRIFVSGDSTNGHTYYTRTKDGWK
jgi:hypothetical protein